MDLIITIITFTIFAIIHSLLASNWIKNKVLTLIKNKFAFYRIFYNILSLITLLLVIKILPDDSAILYKIETPYSYLLLIPFLSGIIGIYFTFKYISFSEFLGISQIKRYFNNTYAIEDKDEKLTLRIEGPYKYTRHPIYFYSSFILFSIPEMTLIRFVFFICIILYFFIGSYFEEQKLIKHFGDKYIEYQKKVPRIIPKLLTKNE